MADPAAIHSVFLPAAKPADQGMLSVLLPFLGRWGPLLFYIPLSLKCKF